jgi:hypothetical protein
MFNEKMLKTKKGLAPVAFVASLIFSFPWIALGIGLFLLAFLLGFYFALGKLIGAGLVVFGGFLTYKLSWKIGLPMMAVGLLFFYNPMDWETLQAVGW